jgi:hypothetical protein
MPENSKTSKKLGRDTVVNNKDLSHRHDAIKLFLEHNWGRIGLRLQRVRKPSDVRSTFKLVPGLQWCSPFRENKLTCLFDDGTEPVGIPELRTTQRLHDEAVESELRLWSEFHTASQQAQTAKTNLNLLLSEFGPSVSTLPFFYVVFVVGKDFRVQELNDAFVTAQALLRKGQERQTELKARRVSQEAWFAQNELVKFRRSKRYEMNPANLAKAMAGLPEYGWLNSFHRCEKLNVEHVPLSPYPFQLFELLKNIVRRMEPLNIAKIELRIRHELLSQRDPILRECVKPRWADLKRAFADYRGKRFTRRELPYLIVGRFLDNMERPKSLLEVEFAKRAEADLNVGPPV